MTREELINWWRRIDQENTPLLVQGHGVTPRHKLVYQARLRLRILDPEVKVWTQEYTRKETGLVVCRWKRYRLGYDRAVVTV